MTSCHMLSFWVLLLLLLIPRPAAAELASLLLLLPLPLSAVPVAPLGQHPRHSRKGPAAAKAAPTACNSPKLPPSLPVPAA
jgi:hypothetical protein